VHPTDVIPISEATNVFIDFSKVTGDPAQDEDLYKKPPPTERYLNFAPGAIRSTCTKSNLYDAAKFSGELSRMMESFQSSSSPPAEYETVDATTYILARDADYENTFHAMADFMNMLLVHMILGSSILPHQQVLLFDRFSNGPYFDLLQKAFSPSKPVLRTTHYGKKTVLFKHLVFHLESPAALIAPEVAIPDPLTCYSTGLFHEFRRHILSAFDLWNTPPPSIPTAVLSLRHRTEHKNVGRVLSNEAEIINVLKEGNMFKFSVMDSAVLSFEQQLRAVRHSNILIGVHGAGLMHIMFGAEECVLLEIHPSYRQDRHFRHAARMTGVTSAVPLCVNYSN
jgi:hypothetical protein